MIRPWTAGGSALVIVAAACVLAATDGAAVGSRSAPICELTGTRLVLDPTGWDTEIASRGEAIEITYRGGSRVVECRGGPPTVRNVDLIRVTESGVDFDLREGPLAPGATDEGDGTSEIEVELASQLGVQSLFSLGSGDDRVEVRRVGGDVGLNLNRGTADADVDVVAAGLFGDISVIAGAGDDRLTAARLMPSREARLALVAFLGGPGSDRLVGSPGPDALIGGGGSDSIIAGDGEDQVISRRGGADRIRCGRGDDMAAADDRDAITGCELTFPRHED